jgi:protoheme IX farnesyltransferase
MADLTTRLDVAAGAPPAALVPAAASGGAPADYIALLKPRVMSLVVFTAVVGMLLAPGSLHPLIAAIATLCIALGAGAAGAINMWYDRDIDALMARTRNRPIPAGRVAPEAALGFGVVLAVGSVALMGLAVNWLAAGLLAFTIFFYIVIYTIALKRSTPQNIVIGGAAGAFPPIVGWAAVSGDIGLPALALFGIIFLWTPPHFWALALCRRGDYDKAGVPMLPVVAGEVATRRQILLYSLALVPVTLVPSLTGFSGLLYGAGAVALGAGFLALAFSVRGDRSLASARRLFPFSILYLFLIFVLLTADRLAGFGAAPS